MIRKYFNFREELSVIERLVLKCDKIIIPVSLRQDTLDKLHQSHLGISKSLLWARSSFCCPGLTKDVTHLIEKCSSCQLFQNCQQRGTLLNVFSSSKLWTSLASDIFKFDGKSYLIVVDHMSKFILVRLIADHSTDTTIKEFIWIFNEHWIPQELHIDRGSNFTCKIFMNFCKSLDINLIYSNAYHHSFNPAEWAFQTVKNLMKKFKCTNQSWCLALLEYLCTPISDMVPCPSTLHWHAFKGLLWSFSRNNNNNPSFSDTVWERHDKENSHFDVNS